MDKKLSAPLLLFLILNLSSCSLYKSEARKCIEKGCNTLFTAQSLTLTRKDLRVSSGEEPQATVFHSESTALPGFCAENVLLPDQDEADQILETGQQLFKVYWVHSESAPDPDAATEPAKVLLFWQHQQQVKGCVFGPQENFWLKTRLEDLAHFSDFTLKKTSLRP